MGLFFHGPPVFVLTYVDTDPNDLGVAVVLFKPGDDDRSIEPSGIGQDNFFNFLGLAGLIRAGCPAGRLVAGFSGNPLYLLH